MLGRRLRQQGFEIAAAPGTASGAWRWRRPSSLPGVDGWEATRRLKEAPETRAIPIIALSAHAMAGDREQALAASCDDYDTKPVNLERLITKIRALLPRKDVGA